MIERETLNILTSRAAKACKNPPQGEGLGPEEVITVLVELREAYDIIAQAQAELERVRQETLLEAAKVICENCEHGWTATLALNEYYHPIPLKGPQLCEASEIYKLVEAQHQGEKGQGES